MPKPKNDEKTVIELPQIKHEKSGLHLPKGHRAWRAIFYEDGKQRSRSTRCATLASAQKVRDEMHRQLIKEGAVYKSSHRERPALKRAKSDPEGMACIYKTTTYKVMVGDVHVITTTSKDKAIAERNKYIKQNY